MSISQNKVELTNYDISLTPFESQLLSFKPLCRLRMVPKNLEDCDVLDHLGLIFNEVYLRTS